MSCFNLGLTGSSGVVGFVLENNWDKAISGV